jgi:small subunit ribosomal protein S4
MSRYRGPRLRIIRRLGQLPGFSRKEPTKQNGPGQHGKPPIKLSKRGKKEKEYAIRLKEKQKLRYNYGITESQLIKYVRKARKEKGSTGEVLLQLLEMRLDSILFRLSLAPTIAAARQLISHGHILVNDKKITIASYQCQPKDKISVAARQNSIQLIQKFFQVSEQLLAKNKIPQRNKKNRYRKENYKKQNKTIVPPHLAFDKKNLIGVIKSTISRYWVSLKLNELLVVEFYSRKV